VKRTSSGAIRESNRSSVVEVLRQHGAMTRAELAAATGLSRATISSLLTQLSGVGMIAEHRPVTQGGTGRPSALVSLDRTADVAVAVGDLSRRVLAERWVSLPHAHSADAGIATVLDCIDQTTAEADARRDQIMGAAISIAAPVPQTERRLAVPGVLPGWNSAALTAAVGERWDVPVAVENDANAGALGESTFGSLAGAPSLVYVKLASRVGLGCVLEGSLYRGGRGFAGELGHITVDPDGERCWCGLRGCLELYAGEADRSAVAEPLHRQQRRLPAHRHRDGAGDLLAVRVAHRVGETVRPDERRRGGVPQPGAAAGHRAVRRPAVAAGQRVPVGVGPRHGDRVTDRRPGGVGEPHGPRPVGDLVLSVVTSTSHR